MNNESLEQFFLFAHKIKDRYGNQLKDCALEYDLTKPEIDILLYLKNHNGNNFSSDIVMHCGCSKSYVSKAIKLLLKKKYIRLENDLKDARYQHIIIEDEIYCAIMILEDIRKKALECITKDISVEELKIFLQVIKKMNENMRREDDL